MAALVGLPGRAVLAAGTVTFAGWGGSLQKAQRQVLFDSFQNETGIRVIDVPDVQLTRIRAMVTSGNVQWDLVQCLGQWIPQGERDNLWAPIDYGAVPRDAVPAALSGTHAIALATFGIAQAYNSGLFKDKPPASWADFWNLQAFPGRRGLFDGPRYCLEAALLADGVMPDKLYPLDLDRAFRSLDRIKGQVHLWWKQWPQAPALLSTGELASTITSSTRITTARKTENAPVATVWNQALMTQDMLAVPRGAPNAASAMKLAAWMLDAGRQAEIARVAAVGPSNPAALGGLSEAEKQELPIYHLQKGEMIPFDDRWWAANEDMATQRWNSWKLS